MSEDLLKEVLKDVNCYLGKTLKKCEMLTEENKKYRQLAKECEAFRANFQALQLMNNELIMDLQNLKQNWKELEGASKEKIISLEEQLKQTERELVSCRENNIFLKNQLNEIEVELSVTKIQSETFENDFNLERESRVKLNDEKLRLLEDLEQIKMNNFHFCEERGQSETVADGRSTRSVRCPICKDP